MLQKTGQRLDGILAGIPTVGNESGNDPEADRFLLFGLQLQRSGESRDMREIPLGEKTIHLEIGIEALLETAELHVTLASDPDNKDFAPEPFTPFYQRSLYQSMRNLCVQVMQLLKRRLKTLPEELQADAEKVLSLNDEILKRFRKVADHPVNGKRIRCHGDYHLGQVLFTGKEFVILDFEGEPARSLSERRLKRPPLRDVGGMIRSFHYAAYAGYSRYTEMDNISLERIKQIEPWVQSWYESVSSTFLRAYVEGVHGHDLIPETEEGFETLLHASLLEKALYELRYELNNRPNWVKIPLHGILQLLQNY